MRRPNKRLHLPVGAAVLLGAPPAGEAQRYPDQGGVR